MFSRTADATPRTPLSLRRLPGSRCAWLASAVLAVVLSWPAAVSVGAADPVFRDVYHTLQARTALLQDPVLANLNLGVRVQDRVATLWGPVPSQEIMQRAIGILSRVPDILEVKCEMNVEVQLEPLPLFLPDQVPQAPAVPLPPPPLPGLSREDSARGVLTRRPAPTSDLIIPTGNVRGSAWTQPPGFPTPNEEDKNEQVLPTIVVPQTRVATAQWTPAVPDWSSLQYSVNSLRLGDSRFRSLQAEARDGRVLLGGSAASWDDVRDFAAGLNRLPGVERVILGAVRIER